MIAAAAVLAAAVQATPPSPAPGEAPSPPPIFSSGVDLVTVDVVVVDAESRAVSGLERSDFTVLEDGRERPIETFEAVALGPADSAAGEQPRPPVSTNLRPPPKRSFVVVFDEQHLTVYSARRAREAVERFLVESVRDGDRVTVVPTGGNPSWAGVVPQDRQDLVKYLDCLAGLRRPDVGPGAVTDWEALRVHRYRDKSVSAPIQRRFVENGFIADTLPPPPGAGADLLEIAGARGEGHPLVRLRAAEVYNESLARRKATLGILATVLDSLAGVRGRKAVVLVSEGFVLEPTLPEVHRVYDAARRGNAAVHFIDTRGLVMAETTVVEQGRPTQSGPSRSGSAVTNDLADVLDQARFQAEGSEAIAAETGGEAFKNSNDIAAGLARLAGEASAFYLLGYAPGRPDRDGKFRRIQVRVARPGMEVRARRGYVVPREADLDPSGREATEAPPPVTPDTSRMPLRLASYVLDEVGQGGARVVLVAEVDPADFAWNTADGRVEDALEATFSVVPRDEGQPQTRTRVVELLLPADVKAQVERGWLPMVQEFALPPGVHQARLVVRERNGGRAGAVSHAFEVPAPGSFRLGTPVLTDMLQEGSDAAAPRPALVARRSFARSGRLFAQYQVLNPTRDAGAGVQVTAGHLLLRRADGTVVSRGQPTPLPVSTDGSLIRTLAVSLGNLEPGAYEITLSARDGVSGRTAERVEPFEVTDAPLPETRPPAASALPQRAAAGSPPSTLPALVDRYATEPARCAAELASWAPDQAREAARRLATESGDPATLRRAALLVTEAAAARPGPAAETYLSAAESLVKAVEEAAPAAHFAARWSVLAALVLEARGRPQDARRRLDKALSGAPGDARALLVAGAFEEARAEAPDPSQDEPPPVGSPTLPEFQRLAARERRLRAAEERYRAALRARPDLAEARLRLGRVLQLRGQDEESRAHLVAVAATSGEAACVSQLFLGEMAEAGGRLADAVEAFRAAAAAAPQAASAHVAAAAVLARLGRVDEAAALVRDALQTPARALDPWIGYQRPALGLLPGALAALREEGR